MTHNRSRRSFLKTTASAFGTAAVWAWPSGAARGDRMPSERPVFGFIGTGLRYEDLVYNAARFGPAADNGVPQSDSTETLSCFYTQMRVEAVRDVDGVSGIVNEILVTDSLAN